MNLHGVPRVAGAGGSAGAPCRPSDKRPSEGPLVQSGPSDGVGPFAQLSLFVLHIHS